MDEDMMDAYCVVETVDLWARGGHYLWLSRQKALGDDTIWRGTE